MRTVRKVHFSFLFGFVALCSIGCASPSEDVSEESGASRSKYCRTSVEGSPDGFIASYYDCPEYNTPAKRNVDYPREAIPGHSKASCTDNYVNRVRAAAAAAQDLIWNEDIALTAELLKKALFVVNSNYRNVQLSAMKGARGSGWSPNERLAAMCDIQVQAATNVINAYNNDRAPHATLPTPRLGVRNIPLDYGLLPSSPVSELLSSIELRNQQRHCFDMVPLAYQASYARAAELLEQLKTIREPSRDDVERGEALIGKLAYLLANTMPFTIHLRPMEERNIPEGNWGTHYIIVNQARMRLGLKPRMQMGLDYLLQYAADPIEVTSVEKDTAAAIAVYRAWSRGDLDTWLEGPEGEGLRRY